MKADAKERLKTILSTFDENGLIALANKGLLRRAQKDLETAKLTLEEADDCLIVKGEGWTVWMPAEGPAKARDDTPATGTTRQILCASIFLREHFFGSAAVEPEKGSAAAGFVTIEPSADQLVAEAAEQRYSPSDASSAKLKQALIELSADDLAKWSGKTIYKEVSTQGALSLESEDNAAGVTLRFPLHDIEVRFFSGKEKGTRLLDSAISTAPKALHRHWVVSAILQLHRQSGKFTQLQEDKKGEAATHAGQKQILLHCKELIESILKVGLAHPSPRMLERLHTISISASSSYLPRLSFMLRALAQELSYLLKRDARGETQRALDSMSWAYALIRAIDRSQESNSELAGVSRTQYDKVGDLKLTGVAAYPWRSESGFEGLTVLFWEQENKRFLSWSASRPSNRTPGFDPRQLYNAESPWTGSGAADRICRATFLLKNARVNASGRISASQHSAAENVYETRDNIEFGERLFSDWQQLHDYAAGQFLCGLRLKNPLDRVVVLKPAGWGDRYFDELQQSLCWQVLDEAGQSVQLMLPWNRINEAAIEFLEAVKPERDRLTGVLTRIVFSTSGFRLEPISLFSSGTPGGARLLNPCFDHQMIEHRQSNLLAQLRKKYGTDRIASALSSEEDWEEMTQANAMAENAPAAVRYCISELEHILLYMAESGTRSNQENLRKQSRQIADKLSRSGLTELAGCAEQIAAEAQTNASNILWTNYLCKLHWQLLCR